MDMFPEKGRFSAFREAFVRRHLAVDVIDHSGGRPRAEVTFMPLGPVAFSSLDTAPAEFVRGRHHLADGRSDVFLLGLVRKSLQFDHAGHERAYGAGTAAFCDHGRQWRAVGPAGVQLTKVTVGTAALRTLVPDAEDLAGLPVRPCAALRLLDRYLRLLAADEPPPARLAPVIGSHVLDLVAAVLGPSRDAAAAIEGRGLRAARLEAVLDEITRRSGDPGFSLEDLASAVGVSPRYVQLVLEETGCSFVEHVLERRLAHAFAMLTDPRWSHLAIIDVAHAAGFGDISHFNRMFRRRHGDTPSAVRGSAGAWQPPGTAARPRAPRRAAD